MQEIEREFVGYQWPQCTTVFSVLGVERRDVTSMWNVDSYKFVVSIHARP